MTVRAILDPGARLDIGLFMAIVLIACEPLPAGADGGEGGTSGDGGVGSCAFEGSYTTQATTYKATGGTYCNKLLTQLAAESRAGETLVFTKIDVTTYQSDVTDSALDAPITWTLDAASCQLRNTTTSVVDSADSAGAPAKVKLDALTFAKLSGKSLTITSSTTITSATQGAQGFPCNLDSSQTGTKK